MKQDEKKLKIAAVGDIHVREHQQENYSEFFASISNDADILILCGDLTDHGLPKEAEILAHQLQNCRIPVVGVLGNHDLEGGKTNEIKKILKSAKMIFLDEETYEINDVGFAGVKGFMGGFDKYSLSCLVWEPATTGFVQEGINEALKLENNISRLRTPKKVVAMHYSPIRETVVGEPVELYSWLGSSRLAEPIDRFDVDLVFHGHSDHGTHQGKTLKGIPVYNVALPLMRKVSPKRPYALVEI